MTVVSCLKQRYRASDHGLDHRRLVSLHGCMVAIRVAILGAYMEISLRVDDDGVAVVKQVGEDYFAEVWLEVLVGEGFKPSRSAMTLRTATASPLDTLGMVAMVGPTGTAPPPRAEFSVGRVGLPWIAGRGPNSSSSNDRRPSSHSDESIHSQGSPLSQWTGSPQSSSSSCGWLSSYGHFSSPTSTCRIRCPFHA